MTQAYAWNPMPHRVSVACPVCAAQAVFEFSEIVKIRRGADVAFFQGSRLFEYALVTDGWANEKWHGAIFYAGLHGGSTSVIRELPGGYAPEEWNHSRYLVRSRQTDRGTVVCPTCGLRRKHSLVWPDNAWFQIDYRGKTLWAFDQESALALRDFITSKERKTMRRQRWSSFLIHVPTEFLVESARATIVKRLERFLGPR